MNVVLNQIIDALKSHLETAETEPGISLFQEVNVIYGKSREQLNELVENAAPLPQSLIMPDRISYPSLNAVRQVNLRLVIIGDTGTDYTLLDQTADRLHGVMSNQMLNLNGANCQLRRILPLETAKQAWMFFLTVKSKCFNVLQFW